MFNFYLRDTSENKSPKGPKARPYTSLGQRPRYKQQNNRGLKARPIFAALRGLRDVVAEIPKYDIIILTES